MPGVNEAEGRRTVSLRVQVGDDEWRSLRLFVVSDYDDIRINQIRPEAGEWGPSVRELMLERASVSLLRAGIGDSIRVETPQGRLRDLKIVGLAHDLNQFPTPLSGTAYGYITFETLEWLGWERSFNELHIVLDGTPQELADVTTIRRVAQEVAKKVEKSGRTVNWTWIPTPGKHPADEVIQPLLLILGVLGILSLLMSGFLVVNTMVAILTQHVRQIGVMKAVGARVSQLMAMYLSMVLLLSLAAMCLGIPLASYGARTIADYLAILVNFDIQNYGFGADIILLEIGVGLMVPLLASLYPVISGTRRTVREAISDSGTAGGGDGQGWFDRVLRWLHWVTRPILLSLRNTFRRKGRLTMTLITLTLGGAIFTAVMSVHQSLLLTLDDAMRYWNYDVSMGFTRSYRVDHIEREALRIPGVVAAESWGGIPPGCKGLMVAKVKTIRTSLHRPSLK